MEIFALCATSVCPKTTAWLAYWDTIADRLFKIRHCMSIDGTVRQLPLFEPPIDPMLLVEAVAHGLDIGSVLNDLYAPLPRYRFTFTLQQALALCNEVRSLGSTLLSVLEKRDAEMLSTLRAGQETQLLDQVKANKKLQIDEAEQSRQALEETARMTSARIEYYENLLAQGLISEETDQLGTLDRSNERQETASEIEAGAQLLNLIPNFGFSRDPSVSFGGSNLGAALSAVGRSYSYLAASYSYKPNRAPITGGQTRHGARVPGAAGSRVRDHEACLADSARSAGADRAQGNRYVRGGDPRVGVRPGLSGALFPASQDRQYYDSGRRRSVHERERHGHAAQQQGA